MDPDTFRYITLGFNLLACLVFPWAIWYRNRSFLSLLIIILVLVQFVGASLAITDNLGGPIVWYRTPRIFLADIIALIYAGVAFAGPNNVQRARVHRDEC